MAISEVKCYLWARGLCVCGGGGVQGACKGEPIEGEGEFKGTNRQSRSQFSEWRFLKRVGDCNEMESYSYGQK